MENLEKRSETKSEYFLAYERGVKAKLENPEADPFQYTEEVAFMALYGFVDGFRGNERTYTR